MFKKLTFSLFLFIIVAGLSGAQQQTGRPWWYTLERGKFHFRNGSYGDALMVFEDARRSRNSEFSRKEQELILLLSTPDVRRFGDSLEWVEWYIADQKFTNIATNLAQVYHYVPKESLGGSVNQVLKALDRLKLYPEAEYWLGETYRAEGELTLALRQYERAWNNRELLETPQFEIEILYKILDIHRIRTNYQDMERYAREIIEGRGPSGGLRDELWVGSFPGAQNQLRAAMARLLENEGINRFLTLYRHNNINTERAHRLLGFFYTATNRFSPAADHLMFAFLIQNSVIIGEIIRREYDFTFTSLEDLMNYIIPGSALAAFMEETQYFRTAYYLSSALQATGKTLPAAQLWAFLAGSNNAGDWGNRARRSPVPIIERALEMP